MLPLGRGSHGNASMVICSDLVPGGKLNRACLMPSQSCKLSGPDIGTFSLRLCGVGYEFLSLYRKKKEALDRSWQIYTESRDFTV